MRIAVPKGRLQEPVLAALRDIDELGNITFPKTRSYHGVSRIPGIKATLIKPRAIPQLLGLDVFDIGFCGLDLVQEADELGAIPVADLGLNRVRILVGVPATKYAILDRPPPRPLVIATEYPKIAERWAIKRGLACITVETFGGTEAYVPDIADIVIDCVETGATLEANGLIPMETLLESSTHLVVSSRFARDKRVSNLGLDHLIELVQQQLQRKEKA